MGSGKYGMYDLMLDAIRVADGHVICEAYPIDFKLPPHRLI
jgi:hypothetical protein